MTNTTIEAKIEKLAALANCSAATAGERSNALDAIERLRDKLATVEAPAVASADDRAMRLAMVDFVYPPIDWRQVGKETLAVAKRAARAAAKLRKAGKMDEMYAVERAAMDECERIRQDARSYEAKREAMRK